MTQMSKALSVFALAAAAGLTLAGCGKSGTGTPTSVGNTTTVSTSTAATATTTTDSVAAQWDPCSIADSAISGLGLDIATKSNQVAGTTFDGWKVCSWKSTDKTFDFTVFTSGHTLAELKQRTDFEDFTPTTIGGRQALQYRSADSNHDLGCSISAQISGGTVDFDVLNRYGTPSLGDPCTAVLRLANGLGQYLP